MQIIYTNGYIHHAKSDCGRFEVVHGDLRIDGAGLQWGNLWTASGPVAATRSDIDAVFALKAEIDAINNATRDAARAAADAKIERSRTPIDCDGRLGIADYQDGKWVQ